MVRINIKSLLKVGIKRGKKAKINHISSHLHKVY